MSTSIVRFLVWAPRGKPGSIHTEAARRLYGNHAISVELPCSLRSLQTVIVRSLCGFRSEAAWRWCDDRAVFFSVRPSRGARAGIVRYYLGHVYGLRTYKFSNLSNFPLNKIAEATEPVNLYENLTAASCLHTEVSRRPHGKGDTGRIQAP